MEFSIKDFFSKCDQIRRKIRYMCVQCMREEASFHMFFEKVKASKGKLEIDDTQLSKKRKVSRKELS